MISLQVQHPGVLGWVFGWLKGTMSMEHPGCRCNPGSFWSEDWCVIHVVFLLLSLLIFGMNFDHL